MTDQGRKTAAAAAAATTTATADRITDAWLTAPETRAVMEALAAGDGQSVTARFVGGCVRNALKGEAVTDVDIATVHAPEEVMARLRDAGLAPVSVPRALAHGTVSVHAGERRLEITTLRVDATTDGRHAGVAFTGDWLEDARRRDFTMNALYADPDGTVHDPLDGRRDLAAGRVRFIGAPRDRIAEDYLRILRFFRFTAACGRGAPDPQGLAACTDLKDGLARLSGERVQAEMLRLLAAPGAPQVLGVMAAAGVLDRVLPEAAQLGVSARLVEIEDTMLFTCDPVLRLGALLAPGGVSALAQRWRLAGDMRTRLENMLADGPKIVCYLSMREVRRTLYQTGPQTFKDRVMLAWARDPKAANAVQWRALLAMADSWERPRFPLTGDMVRAAGVPEGPEVGRVMGEVEDWWQDVDFTEDIFSLIERLKAVVQATVY